MCNVGIAPSEYWRMSPAEVGLVLEYNSPVEMYGSLTADDVDELAQMRNGSAPVINGVQTKWL